MLDRVDVELARLSPGSGSVRVELRAPPGSHFLFPGVAARTTYEVVVEPGSPKGLIFNILDAKGGASKVEVNLSLSVPPPAPAVALSRAAVLAGSKAL